MKLKLVILLFFLAPLLFSQEMGGWKVDCCDGYFYAVSDKPMTQGWSPFLEFNVKNGEISNLRFDKIKKEKLASENNFYNSLMKKKSGTSPAEYSKTIPAMFLQKHDADKMDVIAGATQSTEEFKVMMKYLLQKGKEGTPGKFTIDSSLLEQKK